MMTCTALGKPAAIPMPTEQMLLEILQEKTNSLLKRRELTVKVHHAGKPTPDRQTLKAEVARVANTAPNQVYIQKVTTDYGAGLSECLANVYDSARSGEVTEPEYMRKRNTPPEAKKEEKPIAQPPAQQPIVPEKSSQPTTTEEPPAESESKPKTPRKREPKEKKLEEASAPDTVKKESTAP